MWLPKYKTITITNACQLSCLDCDSWQAEPTHKSLTDILEESKNATIINLCGGNPLLHPDIGKIIANLKKQGKLLIVTTSGLTTHCAPSLLRACDHVILYMPHTDQQELHEISGKDSYKDYIDNLDYLKELGISTFLIVPTSPESLEQLPEAYALVRSRRQTKLIILAAYTKFSAKMRPYLTYYEQQPNAIVLYQEQHNTSACHGNLAKLENYSLGNVLFFLRLFSKMYLRF